MVGTISDEKETPVPIPASSSEAFLVHSPSTALTPPTQRTVLSTSSIVNLCSLSMSARSVPRAQFFPSVRQNTYYLTLEVLSMKQAQQHHGTP